MNLASSDPGFYIRFINMLINDAIYLLDESLKKLPEIKELEAAMDNAAEWAAQVRASAADGPAPTPSPERVRRVGRFRRSPPLV